jgi:uncharacterized membrane protein YeaQ/YmgE (transglycosylase-associated protein family)
MLTNLIVTILVGALAGWVAGKIMKSDGSLIRNIILGILGGLLGGWIASILNVSYGLVVGIIIAIAGACLLIWLARKLFK